MEIVSDDAEVLHVISVQPHLDSLGGPATDGLRHNEHTTRPKHSMDLFENFQGSCQIGNRYNTSDHINLVALQWDQWVHIQILHYVVSQLLVLTQLKLVHTQSNASVH